MAADVYHTDNTVLNDLADKSADFCEGMMEIFRKAYIIVERDQLISFASFLTQLEEYNALPHTLPPSADTLLGIQAAMNYFSHYFHNLGPDNELTEANYYNIHQNIEENCERLFFRLEFDNIVNN